MVPKLTKRNLPAIRREAGEGTGENMQERELLYKVLFDMKNDLNHVKGLIFELIRNNNLTVDDNRRVQALSSLNGNYRAAAEEIDRYSPLEENFPTAEPLPRDLPDNQPIIVDRDLERHYDESEVVEEDLSLENNEKELIRKALKKHNGRRKEAAGELGISERTLYRKIKEYQL